MSKRHYHKILTNVAKNTTPEQRAALVTTAVTLAGKLLKMRSLPVLLAVAGAGYLATRYFSKNAATA